ncbi:hypothetical protein M514_25449 [Trichuris suis]|uniref:DDE-1 domain-containing protein n=1 Tax=Trichuris suis TaxID=68888 RepID=A0A085MYN0_9BILA|nr:hypothetical protein M514_25449 [Trichuris suis]
MAAVNCPVPIYLLQTSEHALEVTESLRTLLKYWKGVNILNAIRNVSAAWKEATERCVKGIWKKALKTWMNRVENFYKNSAIDEIVSDGLVRPGNELQLDLNEEDIHQLINVNAEQLTNEDLIKLEEK